MMVLLEPSPTGADTNPYLGLLAAALRTAGVTVGRLDLRSLRAGRGPLVVHVHWPEFVLLGPPRRVARGCLRLLGLLVLARARGVPVLWTAHNVEGHEREHPAVAAAFWRVFTRLVSGTVLLDGAGRRQVAARHPGLRRRPWFVTGHGRLPLGPLPQWQAARRLLGLAEAGTVLAQTGQVRRYKDPRPLVAAVADAHRLSPETAPLLVVAGDCPDPQLRAGVTAATAGAPHVRLRLARLPDDELAAVLSACDVVAQPYRAHLNSGSVFLALQARRRVLVPATPVTDALAAEVGQAWVLRYTPPLTGAALLALLAQPAPDRPPDLAAQEWPLVAGRTAAAYASVLSGSPAGRPCGRRCTGSAASAPVREPG